MSTEPTQATDPMAHDYTAVGPIRTFYARVQFLNVGPMPPMKIDFEDDDHGQE